ncbi:MAG TPA: gephyrin-like molybdotransferase Glp [Candidatus Limnocylindrales bacterium]|nr:gephyrin-like molybdotransferase Glp [Candidatus Limnocylindrales bacterium]
MTAAGDPGATALLTVEEARAAVLGAIRGATPAETVPLGAALGRVLATGIESGIDLPPWDNSAMDGYALRSGDTASATPDRPVALRVVGDVAAGAASAAGVDGGTCLRIATGARLPEHADAVVPVEDTFPADAAGDPIGPASRDATGPLPASIRLTAPVRAGGSVRRRGSDLRAGDRILAAGTRLGPAAIAVAAGVGVDRLDVHRPPIVGILATGDEVRAPGASLGDAGIPDANGPALTALVAEAGGEPRSLGIARDTLDDVRSRLCAGLGEAPDLVIVSGGVSVGPYDHVRTAFAELGTVDLWRVAVQPGKPFAFGTTRSAGPAGRPDRLAPVLLFGLPGNPVSTFITFELFVRPAIQALLGLQRRPRAVDRAVLLDEARTSKDRRAYLRVTADRDGDGRVTRDAEGRAQVRLARGPNGQGSHVLSALAAADALAIVPEGVETHPAGGPVDIWWLESA